MEWHFFLSWQRKQDEAGRGRGFFHSTECIAVFLVVLVQTAKPIVTMELKTFSICCTRRKPPIIAYLFTLTVGELSFLQCWYIKHLFINYQNTVKYSAKKGCDSVSHTGWIFLLPANVIYIVVNRPVVPKVGAGAVEIIYNFHIKNVSFVVMTAEVS